MNMYRIHPRLVLSLTALFLIVNVAFAQTKKEVRKDAKIEKKAQKVETKTAKNPAAKEIKDSKAAAILKAVSAKYRTFNSLKADFSYSLQNPQEKINETQNGTLHLKGTKFKVNIAGQEIICDNKTKWTYVKESKEVMISTPKAAEGEINPADIFTMYEKGFSYLFIAEKTVDGKVCQIIDLTPTDKSKQYFKVRLTVDKKASQLVQSNIFDKNGSHYIYTIKTFTPNPKLEDSFFTFDTKKYPGVEVVDLR